MPQMASTPELQLKVVQRNYDSISRLMHGKQQECEKVSWPLQSLATACAGIATADADLQLALELESSRGLLAEAANKHQEAVSQASRAEERISVCARTDQTILIVASLVQDLHCFKVLQSLWCAGAGVQAAKSGTASQKSAQSQSGGSRCKSAAGCPEAASSPVRLNAVDKQAATRRYA